MSDSTQQLKEIVVISGKGGTGKTSLTASFAMLGGDRIVTADCDVDAADMHLLLQPEDSISEPFFSGEAAVVEPDKCLGCGRCARVCRWDAFKQIAGGKYRVNQLDCEGCGYCARICPAGAITMVEQQIGHCYNSRIRNGGRMIHARLQIGAENSGKLVAKVKNDAKQLARDTGKQLVLVDGSPGIGCPVVSSLSGASYVILVTEPTVSGLHDLQRVAELVIKFNIPAGGIINKADLNPESAALIRRFLSEHSITLLNELPYDESFSSAMTAGKTVLEEGSPQLRQIIRNNWNTVCTAVCGGELNS